MLLLLLIITTLTTVYKKKIQNVSNLFTLLVMFFTAVLLHIENSLYTGNHITDITTAILVAFMACSKIKHNILWVKYLIGESATIDWCNFIHILALKFKK